MKFNTLAEAVTYTIGQCELRIQNRLTNRQRLTEGIKQREWESEEPRYHTEWGYTHAMELDEKEIRSQMDAVAALKRIFEMIQEDVL